MPWESTTSDVALALLMARCSLVAGPLLPRPPLQPEVAEEDCGEQERHHCRRDGRTFAEVTAGDRALEGERRHQVRCVERAATRQHVDQLEVGEGEEHR